MMGFGMDTSADFTEMVVRLFCAFAGVLIVFPLYLYFDNRRRERIKSLFPAYDVDDGVLSLINSILHEIGVESRCYYFVAERYESVKIDNQAFVVVYGSLWCESGVDSYGKDPMIFSLVRTANQDWFKQRKYLFSRMYEGATYSIFLTDLKRLRALQNELPRASSGQSFHLVEADSTKMGDDPSAGQREECRAAHAERSENI
jgi:hypothetical protein